MLIYVCVRVHVCVYVCVYTYTCYRLLATSLPDAVVVELVIAGESDESSPAQRQREEHLHCCICPHLYQHTHLQHTCTVSNANCPDISRDLHPCMCRSSSTRTQLFDDGLTTQIPLSPIQTVLSSILCSIILILFVGLYVGLMRVCP